MRKIWEHYFEKGGIERRILSRGIALAVMPLLLMVIVTLIVQQVANSVAVAGSFKLATQDLNHTVEGLLGASESNQENIAKALSGAKVFLDRAGRIEFDESKQINWKAKNQFSEEVLEVSLPTMMAGSTRFTPVSDFSQEAPVVDEVEQLFKMTATVFQRMDERGDMLRIATTVKKKSGERAIGTFIPAVGADGKANPVLAAVLQGKTYLGRAFVVNAWFIAAYQPIRAASGKDGPGKIVGMIYTGLPEVELRDQLGRFSARVSGAGKTDVFVLHTAGPAKGLFVLSNDKALEGHNSWDAKDAQGKLFVRYICQKALLAKPGEISEATYWAMGIEGQAARKMIVRFTYYPAWDWVIGVQQPEEEFLSTPNRIRTIFRVTDWLLPLLCIAAAVAASMVWHKFVGKLSGRIAAVIGKLKQSARQLDTAADAIGERSGSVAASASELMRATQSQAAASEETSVATGSVTETAKVNYQTAESMRTLSAGTETILKQAVATLGDVDSAMQSISSTSGNVLGIADSINEISFATNIVSLNASIEAARAGEAGVTFAYIAGEVRSLAKKCAGAADETKKIVSQSRTEMERGSQLVGRLVNALHPIGKSSDQIRDLATEVSATSKQQAESLRQVLEAVEQIQRASESSAQAARKGADDAEELQSQVTSLVRSVSEIEQAIEILNNEFALSGKAAS